MHSLLIVNLLIIILILLIILQQLCIGKDAPGGTLH